MGASASAYQSYTVIYQETIDWLPVFDPDYCEGQYNADEVTLEEFGFEEYTPVIPVELEKYVDGKALQRIWSEKYVFAEDVLQNIAQLLNTFLIFDENDIEEGIEVIDDLWNKK